MKHSSRDRSLRKVIETRLAKEGVLGRPLFVFGVGEVKVPLEASLPGEWRGRGTGDGTVLFLLPLVPLRKRGAKPPLAKVRPKSIVHIRTEVVCTGAERSVAPSVRFFSE